MDTDTTVDPATQESLADTPVTDETVETVNDDTSTDGKQEDAATLKKRLADKDRLITELRSKATKPVPDTRSEEIKDLEWKLTNQDRISLVKDEFTTIVNEGYEGEKVSKKIALELAEKKALKNNSTHTQRDRADDMSTPSVTNRSSDTNGYSSDAFRLMGIDDKKKKALEAKYPHLKDD